MSNPSNGSYLESKVLTATQPQLHLMLLEGALRFGRQAKQLWTDEASFTKVDPALARMADIVDELAHGTAAGEGEIAKQLEEQYAFLYRELAACRINQDADLLESCLELLAFHVETWKLAADRVNVEIASPTPTSAPHLESQSLSAGAGFSLEA